MPPVDDGEVVGELPDLAAFRVPGHAGPQTGKSQGGNALRDIEIRRSPLERVFGFGKLVRKAKLSDNILLEACLQLFERHAAVPARAHFVEDVRREGVSF